MNLPDGPDTKYLKQLQNIDIYPIFILGLHRSGTSILYKMLVKTGSFNAITAYHLINYDELLSHHIRGTEEQAKQTLNAFFQHSQQDRGIDKLPLTADFAEEYGFLLGKHTFAMNITDKNKDLFVELARKVQFIAENSKPLLLKNPYDFPNFLYIKKEFPQAKFIFIHRHPLAVLSSTIKAMRLLLNHKNPYTTELFKLYNVIFKNPLLLFVCRLFVNSLSSLGICFYTLLSAKSTNHYLKNIAALDQHDYIAITYEQLCKYPQATMEDILRFLRITPPKNLDFTTFIHPRKTTLDSSVRQMKRFIYTCMKRYFTTFNYDCDIED